MKINIKIEFIFDSQFCRHTVLLFLMRIQSRKFIMCITNLYNVHMFSLFSVNILVLMAPTVLNDFIVIYQNWQYFLFICLFSFFYCARYIVKEISELAKMYFFMHIQTRKRKGLFDNIIRWLFKELAVISCCNL